MLQQIYKNQIEKERQSKEGMIMDRRITRIANTIDYEKLKNDKVYVSGTLYKIALIGDEKGFIRGCKYAVQLLACCFD